MDEHFVHLEMSKQFGLVKLLALNQNVKAMISSKIMQ